MLTFPDSGCAITPTNTVWRFTHGWFMNATIFNLLATPTGPEQIGLDDAGASGDATCATIISRSLARTGTLWETSDIRSSLVDSDGVPFTPNAQRLYLRTQNPVRAATSREPPTRRFNRMEQLPEHQRSLLASSTR